MLSLIIFGILAGMWGAICILFFQMWENNHK